MEDKYIATIIVAVVGILIGLALFTTSAGFVGRATTLETSTNAPFTLPATTLNGDLTVCGQQNTTAISIANATSGLVLTTGNYTVDVGAGSDGYLSTRINATAGTYAGKAVYVNCSYQPYGYINNAGTRTIFGLVIIFGALLIAITALPQARDWMKGMVGM